MAIAEAELSQLHKKHAQLEVREESLQQREQQFNSKQQELEKIRGKQHEQELRELLEREKNQAVEEKIRSLEEERKKLEALMTQKEDENVQCLQSLRHCMKRAEEKVMNRMLNYFISRGSFLKCTIKYNISYYEVCNHIKGLNIKRITDAYDS